MTSKFSVKLAIQALATAQFRDTAVASNATSSLGFLRPTEVRGRNIQERKACWSDDVSLPNRKALVSDREGGAQRSASHASRPLPKIWRHEEDCDLSKPGCIFRQFTRKKTETRTRLVSEIVGYLCRVQQSADMTHEKFTVNFAKEFIRQQNRYGGRSKISKDWERYARSAAFIYAAYQCFPKLAEFRNWRELWGELNQFAAQEDEVKKLIGYAAFAAQVLDRTHVRSSLTKPFLVADIVTPNLRQFDQNELRLLAEIDLKAPIA